MARTGFTASNYFSLGAAPVTATPLTMACWGLTTATGTGQTLMDINNGSSGSTLNYFGLRRGTTNELQAVAGDGTTGTAATSTTNPATNQWFHAAAVFASATSRAVYLNGASKGTNTTSRVPSGLNKIYVGVRHGSPVSEGWPGNIAEAAIWNIALSDADILALSKGLSPLLMHPESLVAYWPLIGNNSPENNLKSNSATMSIVGSLSKAAHPRIFMPGRKRLAA